MNPEISTLLADLKEAQEDLDLKQRLDNAEKRVEQLTKAYNKELAALKKRQEDARQAALKARFDGLSNIRVIGSTPQHSDSVLHKSYKITWKGSDYDMGALRSVIRERSSAGFAALPSNIFDFLIEKHPEQIPPEIMALCPDDPRRAFAEYFAAKRRGYTRGKPAQ